ncbi:hypothetical protein CCR85_12350 [Rhodothalassium salexigens]|nr:hypothetical protein [Rhodothalassium salexigens]MBK5920297.1 hypothetical protein [Rhodothalassium salexigens]
MTTPDHWGHPAPGPTPAGLGRDRPTDAGTGAPAGPLDARATPGRDWWKGAVIYHVYPRSFLDTNGDGIGDLAGIIGRLDYIAALGVDGLWVSPFFRSPMRDFGYDVSDYRDVDPMFGTLEDADALIEAAHARGLKLIIDLVLSHTSDRHAWFQESRASRTNAKADWYVWADPRADGSPPNNWQSFFGGPAWTWDTRRHQYYLHNFLHEQPDLNLHSPEVQKELLDVARFWLERGVDGFRLDVANFYFHDPLLRDNPAAPDVPADTRPYYRQRHIYDKSRPENLAFLERLRALLDAYDGRMAVAEIEDDDPLARTAEYTQGHTRLHTAYNFVYLGHGGALDGRTLTQPLKDWRQHGAASWPSWAFSNHDVPRVASRFGADPDQVVLPRLYLAILLTLQGTVFLYQGEELGLPQADVPYERLQDPEAIKSWPQTLGRDGARTPMPWSADAPHAGFSDAEPWLPVAPQHRALAVDRQEADAGSTLHAARALLRLRRAHPALVRGRLDLLDLAAPVVGFVRSLDAEATADAAPHTAPPEAATPDAATGGGDDPRPVLAAFNLSDRPQSVAHPAFAGATQLATPLTGRLDGDTLMLPPWGGLLAVPAG